MNRLRAAGPDVASFLVPRAAVYLFVLCCLLAMVSACVRFQAVGSSTEALDPTAAGGDQVPDPQLQRFLDTARQARLRGDIDQPKHDSAIFWLQAAMHHAPGHPLVRVERERVLHAGVRAALDYGHARRYKAAELLLTHLQKLGMRGAEIQRARQRLAQLYRQRSIELVPPAQVLTGAESSMQQWLRTELMRYKDYAGWVDVLAPSDRQGIAVYRQVQRATPGRNWRVRVLHGSELSIRLHYQIR